METLNLHTDEYVMAYTTMTDGNNKATFAYLICEWDGEIKHLAIQLPFSLVLHVGDLHFNCHRTLQRKMFSFRNLTIFISDKYTYVHKYRYCT